MALFEYGEKDTEENENGNGHNKPDDGEFVRLSDNGDGYTHRMTVPSAVVNSLEIESGQFLRVQETDSGFKAEVVDI